VGQWLYDYLTEILDGEDLESCTLHRHTLSLGSALGWHLVTILLNPPHITPDPRDAAQNDSRARLDVQTPHIYENSSSSAIY